MQLNYHDSRNKKVKRLDEELTKLMTKIFVWGTENNIKKAVFIQQIEIGLYETKIKFSDYTREKLEVIRNALIINDFTTLQSFRSVYAERLYKQIQSWKDNGELTLTVKDFRDFLGVPKESYKKMFQLKNRTLKPAIKEINEKSNFKLDYEDIKENGGRAITHFRFFWLYDNPIKYEDLQIKKWEKAIKRLLLGKYMDTYKTLRIKNYDGECKSKSEIIDYKMKKYNEDFIAHIYIEGYDCECSKWVGVSNIKDVEELIIK
jgi:plasmid replication initiation protein